MRRAIRSTSAWRCRAPDNTRTPHSLTAASTIDYIRPMPITRAACALLIASFAFGLAPRCFADEVEGYTQAAAHDPSAAPAPSGNVFRTWFGSKETADVDTRDFAPEVPVAEAGPAASGPAQRASELVVGALGLLGIAYRFGGDTPRSGFDCSGMVRYVFQQTLGVELPRRAEEISRVGTKVDRKHLKPGDLVFYNTLKRTFSHVGIYLGNHQFIHAPARGGVVRVEDMNESYWVRRFTGARRIAN